MAKNIVEIIIQAKNNTAQAFTQAKSNASNYASALGNIGTAMASLGLTVGAKELLDWSMESVALAREQIRVELQLQAVLKSTGGAAGFTADEVKRLASELQGVTNFGDEATIAGQNLLLTFTNIGRDVFPAVTQTMLDMSVAMGQDLKSSALQLGKALNDPVTGLSRLQEVGVTFTAAQKEQVKSMVELGNVAGAQGVILQELQKEFGGSAAAARQSAGEYVAMGNALGDLREVIGTQMIPALDWLYGATRRSAEGFTYAFGTAPALIEAAKTKAAEFGATMAITAKTFDDFGKAGTEGSNNWQAFDTQLKANTKSFAEYDAIIRNLAQQFPALTVEVDTAEAAFNAAKKAAADHSLALRVQGQAALYASFAEDKLAQSTNAAAAAARTNSSANASAAAAARQIEIDKAKEAYDAEQALELAKVKARESANVSAANARSEQEKPSVPDYGGAITDNLKDAADDMTNAITGAVNTAYDRVAQVVPELGGKKEGDEAGEFGRRLAALADGGMAGLDQQWADSFKQQAGGNPIYAGLLLAMEQSDSAGVASQAQSLLANNLAAVLATGLPEALRAQVSQQNLMQQVQDIVAQEMGAQPVNAQTGVQVATTTDVTGAQTEVQGALDTTAQKAGAIKTNIDDGFSAAIKATDAWIIRINELNRVLGIANGALTNIKNNMNTVAPATSTPGAGVGTTKQ